MGMWPLTALPEALAGGVNDENFKKRLTGTTWSIEREPTKQLVKNNRFNVVIDLIHELTFSSTYGPRRETLSANASPLLLNISNTISIAGIPTAISKARPVTRNIAGPIISLNISHQLTIAGLPINTGPPQTATRLLLPFTGQNNSTTFTDHSPFEHVVTPNGNVKISTDESIFDGSSAYFSGHSSAYLTIPASSAFMFSGQWTLEGWIYLPETPTGSYAAIFDSRNLGTGNTAILLAVDSSRRLKLFSGPDADLVSSTNALPLNTWIHYAVSQTETVLGLYAGGSQLAAINSAVNRVQNGPVYIGRVHDDAHPALKAYLSYLRLSPEGLYSGAYTVPDKFPL
jgi:hypothetical protein